jgi:ribosomal protein S27AE
MVFCPSCGKENIDDAVFCNKCGVRVTGEYWASVNDKIERFGEDMDKFGQEVGDKAEKWARNFAAEVERMVRSESVCPKCSAVFVGRHNYCGKCGTEIP